jgi:tellurite resistance protein TerB
MPRPFRFSPWPIVLLLAALAAYLSPQSAWNRFGQAVPQVTVPHDAPDTGAPSVPVPAELTPQARKLFTQVRPASVQIEQLSADGSGGLGSGFFISGKGLLLTAYHVVDGARVIRVRTVSDQTFIAQVVGFDNAADGSVSPDERRKMAGFISSNDALKVFPAADLKTRFDKYADKLSADFDFGRIEAQQAIGKLRSKPDQARAVIQLGLIIGAADGNFDESERGAVRAVALSVGLDPNEFGV